MEYFEISNRRYLGCKQKLLTFLDEIIVKNTSNCKSFLDVFAGTGVVAEYFNEFYDVTVNDNLISNYYAYKCFLSREKINQDKVMKIIEKYNKIQPKQENYYSVNFGDTYLSEENMRKVGYIRDDIDKKYEINVINSREHAILITSLLYAIDRIANTVGHYDAYRRNGDLNKILELRFPKLKHTNFKTRIFKEDANALVRKIKADICYLDPPYNSRQYCDAYHFLENVASNEKAEVYGTAKKMDRRNLKSEYCKTNAKRAFEDLIEHLEVKYILLSYNNTAGKANARSNAKISDKDILEILNKKGNTKIFVTKFNPFSTGKTKIENHEERVFLCTVGKFNNHEEHLQKIQTQSPLQKIQTQSPLNYTGGKYKLLNQIQAKFPDKINVFYDIFCGGFNVGNNVSANKIIAIDNNKALISLFCFLQKKKYNELINEIEQKIREYGLSNTYQRSYEYYGCNSSNGLGKYNKEGFLKLRKDYNETRDDLLFLLLIFFSFNNQIRFNGSNQFNLPVGKRDFNKNIRKKLKNFLANLNACETHFRCMDFRDINLDEVAENTFFYLDPPYSLGTASYNENNLWGKNDDLELLEFLDKCNVRGIKFALSNVIEHKDQKNIELINWTIKNSYNVNYIKCNYRNSSYHGKFKNSNAITKEVLITNY